MQHRGTALGAQTGTVASVGAVAGGPDRPYARGPVPEPTRPSEPEPAVLRAALLPVSLGLAVLLYYGLGLPFAIVGAVAGAFTVLFLVAPAWARASTRSFDRDAVSLLAAGERDLVRTRYRQALGMRLFAPPAIAAERRGMVAAELGDHEAARAAYRQAATGYELRPPMGVQIGYAHACYELEDDTEAIRAYRQLLSAAGSLPRVRRNLGHCLLRSGQDVPRAIELLEEARRATTADADRSEITTLLEQARRARKKAAAGRKGKRRRRAGA